MENNAFEIESSFTEDNNMSATMENNAFEIESSFTEDNNESLSDDTNTDIESESDENTVNEETTSFETEGKEISGDANGITSKLVGYLKEQDATSNGKLVRSFSINSQKHSHDLLIIKKSENETSFCDPDELQIHKESEIKYEVTDENDEIIETGTFDSIKENNEIKSKNAKKHTETIDSIKEDTKNKRKNGENDTETIDSIKEDTKNKRKNAENDTGNNIRVDNSEDEDFDRGTFNMPTQENLRTCVPKLNLPENDSPELNRKKKKNPSESYNVVLKTYDENGMRMNKSDLEGIIIEQNRIKQQRKAEQILKDEEAEEENFKNASRSLPRPENFLDMFQFNDLYIRRNWDGRIKVVQCLSSFIAAIILPTSYKFYATRYIFHRFITVACFVCSAIDLFLHLSSVWQYIPKWIRSSVLMMVLCFVASMAILASSCLIVVIANVNEDEQESLVSSFCGFFCMVFFGIETILHFFRYRAQLPFQQTRY